MRPKITSPGNLKIKEAVKLREGKHRRRTGLFLLDGLREIRRAVDCGVEPVCVFFREEAHAAAMEALENFPNRDDLLQPVTGEVFEKIAFGDRQEGVLVVARQPEYDVEQFSERLAAKETPLLAVLEKIEKPGNIGAVFRSADGAGLDGVLLADSLADFFSPNVIRNSMGTVFRMPMASLDSAACLGLLREKCIGIAAARCEGAIPYTEYDFRRPTAIVLGNEADGLSDHWAGEEVTAISIPMRGMADSLNISVAAAVLFYEARRQRGHR